MGLNAYILIDGSQTSHKTVQTIIELLLTFPTENPIILTSQNGQRELHGLGGLGLDLILKKEKKIRLVRKITQKLFIKQQNITCI